MAANDQEDTPDGIGEKLADSFRKELEATRMREDLKSSLGGETEKQMVGSDPDGTMEAIAALAETHPDKTPEELVEMVEGGELAEHGAKDVDFEMEGQDGDPGGFEGKAGTEGFKERLREGLAGAVAEKARWVPYQGPRGGEGWKDTASGRVVYDDEPPGEVASVDDFSDDQLEDIAEEAGASVEEVRSRLESLGGEVSGGPSRQTISPDAIVGGDSASIEHGSGPPAEYYDEAVDRAANDVVRNAMMAESDPEVDTSDIDATVRGEVRDFVDRFGDRFGGDHSDEELVGAIEGRLESRGVLGQDGGGADVDTSDWDEVHDAVSGASGREVQDALAAMAPHLPDDAKRKWMHGPMGQTPDYYLEMFDGDMDEAFEYAVHEDPGRGEYIPDQIADEITRYAEDPDAALEAALGAIGGEKLDPTEKARIFVERQRRKLNGGRLDDGIAGSFKSRVDPKGRRYIDDPSEAPEGADVQEGQRGGLFYETGPGLMGDIRSGAERAGRAVRDALSGGEDAWEAFGDVTDYEGVRDDPDFEEPERGRLRDAASAAVDRLRSAFQEGEDAWSAFGDVTDYEGIREDVEEVAEEEDMSPEEVIRSLYEEASPSPHSPGMSPQTIAENARRIGIDPTSAGKLAEAATKAFRQEYLRSGFREKQGPWEPYEGPEGGEGWRNIETGEVRYQKEPPGETTEGEGAPEGEEPGPDEGGVDPEVEEALSNMDEHSVLASMEIAGISQGSGGDEEAVQEAVDQYREISGDTETDEETVGAVMEALVVPEEELEGTREEELERLMQPGEGAGEDTPRDEIPGYVQPDEVEEVWERAGGEGEPPEWIQGGATQDDMVEALEAAGDAGGGVDGDAIEEAGTTVVRDALDDMGFDEQEMHVEAYRESSSSRQAGGDYEGALAGVIQDRLDDDELAELSDRVSSVASSDVDAVADVMDVSPNNPVAQRAAAAVSSLPEDATPDDVADALMDTDIGRMAPQVEEGNLHEEIHGALFGGGDAGAASAIAGAMNVPEDNPQAQQIADAVSDLPDDASVEDVERAMGDVDMGRLDRAIEGGLAEDIHGELFGGDLEPAIAETHRENLPVSDLADEAGMSEEEALRVLEDEAVQRMESGDREVIDEEGARSLLGGGGASDAQSRPSDRVREGEPDTVPEDSPWGIGESVELAGTHDERFEGEEAEVVDVPPSGNPVVRADLGDGPETFQVTQDEVVGGGGGDSDGEERVRGFRTPEDLPPPDPNSGMWGGDWDADDFQEGQPYGYAEQENAIGGIIGDDAMDAFREEVISRLDEQGIPYEGPMEFMETADQFGISDEVYDEFVEAYTGESSKSGVPTTKAAMFIERQRRRLDRDDLADGLAAAFKSRFE